MSIIVTCIMFQFNKNYVFVTNNPKTNNPETFIVAVLIIKSTEEEKGTSR